MCLEVNKSIFELILWLSGTVLQNGRPKSHVAATYRNYKYKCCAQIQYNLILNHCSL